AKADGPGAVVGRMVPGLCKATLHLASGVPCYQWQKHQELGRLIHLGSEHGLVVLVKNGDRIRRVYALAPPAAANRAGGSAQYPAAACDRHQLRASNERSPMHQVGSPRYGHASNPRIRRLAIVVHTSGYRNVAGTSY